jgi:DNA-binding IscR family transcriptional regulator
MTQKDRDRLVALKKAQKKLITQRQAAEELGVTERQPRRVLAKLKKAGDRSLVHGLRGRPSNRKLSRNPHVRRLGSIPTHLHFQFRPGLQMVNDGLVPGF